MCVCLCVRPPHCISCTLCILYPYHIYHCCVQIMTYNDIIMIWYYNDIQHLLVVLKLGHCGTYQKYVTQVDTTDITSVFIQLL